MTGQSQLSVCERKLSGKPLSKENLSVNLLESLCKIVEFIFKIIYFQDNCSYITFCRPRRRPGDGKRQPNFKWRRDGSAIGVTKIDYKQSQIVYFFFLSQGLRFPNF